jgi:hypothetical protein
VLDTDSGGGNVRTRSVVLATLIAIAVGVPGGAVSAKVATPGARSDALAATTVALVTLKAPRKVVEGDRYTIRVTLKQPERVRRLELQQLVADVFGDMTWETVKSLEVNGRDHVKHRVVAGSEDRERYRAVLRLKSGPPTRSEPLSVDVWHWYPLNTWTSYYSTGGVIDDPYNQFAMNGRTYSGGWHTYGSYRSWESRYTLGRNCRSMMGTFGVTDESDDGSSATIRVLSEGSDPVYSSAQLVPGTVDSKLVSLASPYRISIIGTNTSIEELMSFPAAGDLQFLCHGLE